jgi:ATP-dependent Clp protease ATP-binding subunit ClpA
MIAQELEVSLHMAFMDARQKRHELITVEHLLLAMLDNPSASEVLNSCGANLDKLREDVVGHIEEHTPKVGGKDDVDTQPTLGFSKSNSKSDVACSIIWEKRSDGRKRLSCYLW